MGQKGQSSDFKHAKSKFFRSILTLKVPVTTAADDIHRYIFHCFSKKIRLDVSSESSASQALISSKDKSKKLKCRLLQFFVGALRFNFFIKWLKH